MRAAARLAGAGSGLVPASWIFLAGGLAAAALAWLGTSRCLSEFR